MKVFTFWEPKDRIPGYIRACMRTWERNLPNAEVILLDSETIRHWLPDDVYAACCCPKASLPKQADVLRAQLLARHGGLWLDADTIITPAARESEIFAEDRPEEVTMFRMLKEELQEGPDSLSIAFVLARKPETSFVRAWADALPQRVAEFNRYAGNPLLRAFRRKTWRECRRWDYFGNAVVDGISSRMSPKELKVLPMDEYGVFPEYYGKTFSTNHELFEAYREYYFTPGDPADILRISKGIVMLHNSWTPDAFKQMSEEEFLSTDTRLAALLKK